jgi:RND family efflux transporter MFP subunit
MQPSHQLFELASVALSCHDRESLLKTFAARAAALFQATAVVIWLRHPHAKKLSLSASWSESGSHLATRFAESDAALDRLAESNEPLVLNSSAITPDWLAHLDKQFHSRLTALLYAPIRSVEGSLGLVELLRTNRVCFTDDDVRVLDEATRLLAQALLSLDVLSSEHHSHLLTVERLTTLYDLGRTFTSSLELTELLPVVSSKICDVMEAEACNLWLADSRAQELFLAHKTGEDPTTQIGARVSSTEGLLADLVQRAVPKLLEQPRSDADLASRLVSAPGFTLHSWMCAPLRKDDEVLGLVEVLNHRLGRPFTEDDLFFLSSIAEQAAISLHNAKLLDSERKVSALDALLKISQEITSTLDLDQVLTTVVNQAGTIVNFDRFVIGYFDRGQFILGAVSGEPEVPRTAEMTALRACLEWVAKQGTLISADLFEDGWRLDSESSRSGCVPFLEAHQYNGFHAIPLRDDQGPVGAMALLSSRAEFLSPTDREILAILANQTTVAVRNSYLYEQSSALRGFLHPLTSQTRRLRSAWPRQLWLSYAKRVAAVLGLLVLIPWPLRVSTNATVVPAQRRIVSSIAGGVIERISAREGDLVQSGDVLAQLNDGEHRIKLAQAQAALETARRELGEAEFRNDPSAAGMARLRSDLHLAEVQLEQKRLEDAHIRSSLSGIIVTPKVEEKVGTFLKPGEPFAEIVEQDRMAAELSVTEPDLPFVRPGGTVALKLNSFPTRTVHGTVERIGAQTRSDSNEQYFLVRAVFPNPDRVVKDGMVGRARIRAAGGWLNSGWYPLGYVLLRAPLRWLWMKLWTWFP